MDIDWKYKSKNKYGRKVSTEYSVKARYKDLKSQIMNYKYLPHTEIKNTMIKGIVFLFSIQIEMNSLGDIGEFWGQISYRYTINIQTQVKP